MELSPSVPEAVTTLLTALSAPQRQRILGAFFDAGRWELPAMDIAERCRPLSRPAVSHHLGVLRRTGVLTARREGKHVYYAIDRDHTARSLLSFLEFLDVCCPADVDEARGPREGGCRA